MKKLSHITTIASFFAKTWRLGLALSSAVFCMSLTGCLDLSYTIGCESITSLSSKDKRSGTWTIGYSDWDIKTKVMQEKFSTTGLGTAAEAKAALDSIRIGLQGYREPDIQCFYPDEAKKPIGNEAQLKSAISAAGSKDDGSKRFGEPKGTDWLCTNPNTQSPISLRFDSKTSAPQVRFSKLAEYPASNAPVNGATSLEALNIHPKSGALTGRFSGNLRFYIQLSTSGDSIFCRLTPAQGAVVNLLFRPATQKQIESITWPEPPKANTAAAKIEREPRGAIR